MVLSDGQFRFMFTARDYEAAVAFYRDGVGLPVDHSWDYSPSDRGTVFQAGPAIIEVFGAAPDVDYVKPQGMGILLQVDDADRWYQTVQERGLPVLQAPTSYPWGQRVLRLTDPDGIVVSFFSPVKG